MSTIFWRGLIKSIARESLQHIIMQNMRLLKENKMFRFTDFSSVVWNMKWFVNKIAIDISAQFKHVWAWSNTCLRSGSCFSFPSLIICWIRHEYKFMSMISLWKYRQSWTIWGRARMDSVLAWLCLIVLEQFSISHKWSSNLLIKVL